MTTQFRSGFTVRRKDPGHYLNGIWQKGGETLFNINASVQPVTGKELEMLPEGRRTSQTIKIYTDIKLNTNDEANPDILTAFDTDFELTTIENWQSNVINHYKYIGVRIGPSLILDNLRVTVDNQIRSIADDKYRITA